MNNNNFSIIEAVKFGWNGTIKNIGELLRIFWPAIIMTLGYVLLMWIFNIKSDSLLKNVIDFPFQILSTIFAISLLLVSLTIVDGRTEDLKKMNIWSGLPYVFSYFITGAYYSLKVLLGLFLLIIPGIIFSVQHSFAVFVAVDRRVSSGEAMKMSKEITKGRCWKVLLFLIFVLALNVAGLLFFVIGLLVTIPISWLAMTYVYRQLSGPKIEVQNTVQPSLEEVGFKPAI